MGHSSGGHLAMMAVLHNACGMIEMPNVKGVILESAFLCQFIKVRLVKMCILH